MSVPMITCPLCGTQQPNAWDCSACGHPLHERPVQAVQVALLPDLEATRQDSSGNVALEEVPGLEATAVDAVDAPDAPLLELETTAVSRRAEVLVAAEVVPGLEATALEPAAEPTATGGVVCRYCSTPWQAAYGIFCPRCGMRVPAVQSVPKAQAGDAGARPCPGCGTPGQTVGAHCTTCGQKVIAGALS
jgi:hypothetical protein